tara:strand:+ start:23 stop:565 length:543 start_codon:yes stop_codon:yes gene_type:complete
MNKLFLLTLLFSSISYADLDIGEVFEAGDLVSAEEFNNKFGKLKQVVGEIKDSDIIGTWDCISYKPSSDSSHLVENGGNGQVGNGYFYSRSGRLILSEQDEEDSLNSPKNYVMDTNDVLNDSGYDEGFYTLFLNKLHFFNNTGQFNMSHNIEMLSENKISLIPVENSSGYPNPNVVCEKV